jgi:HTH-type transcriptional regulator / antitoxin HipB
MTPPDHTSGRPIALRRAADIADLIKARRKALGLSQQALADRLTISRKWVNEIERGNAHAKLELVLRALNELGIELSGRAGGAHDVRPADDGPPPIDIDAIVSFGRRLREAAK